MTTEQTNVHASTENPTTDSLRASEISEEIKKISVYFPPSEVKTPMQQDQQALKNIDLICKDINGLPEPQKLEKNKDAKEMIKYYISLTNAVEDRLMKIHTFGLQTLALSIAALGIILSNKTALTAIVGKTGSDYLILILLSFCLTSIISELLHYSQARFPYCFKGQNNWKWFYYGNPNIRQMDANPIAPSRDATKTTVPYNTGLAFFLTQYRNENLDSELCGNLKQLYLLQVHNHFKNRFFLQSTLIWKYCMFVVFIEIVALLIAIAVHQHLPLSCATHTPSGVHTIKNVKTNSTASTASLPPVPTPPCAFPSKLCTQPVINPTCLPRQ